MKTDEEKAEEIRKKRRLAAKGLRERSDGKPVDPTADIASLDPDDKTLDPDRDEPSRVISGSSFVRGR
jgi:hypothetical protein